MKHPAEADLALFAGRDQGFIAEWRIGRHLTRCGQCRATVEAYEMLRSKVAALGDFPEDLAWDRLASEMKANIRLGLAAGECVAGYPEWEKAPGWPSFSGLQTLLAYAGVILLVVAGVWLQRPAPPIDRGAAALSANNNDISGAMVAVSGDGIQLTEGGRGLGLRYGAFRDVNYSANASGSMGARYVDTSTGYVTVVNVNVE